MSLEENSLQTDVPILPSIIGNSQEEIKQRFEKISDLNNTVHVDVMDGDFVDSQSFCFDFNLPDTHQYHYHLMVVDPLAWIERCIHAGLIIFHIEIEQEIGPIIQAIKAKGIKVGIAISPDSNVDQLAPYIDDIDAVLVMTVVPGHYGAPFRLDALSHVRTLSQHRPDLPIIVDGSVSALTIGGMNEAGATHFVCGSYLQRHQNPHEAVKLLMSKLQ